MRLCTKKDKIKRFFRNLKIVRKLKEFNKRLQELTCMTKGHKFKLVGDFGKASFFNQWTCKRCKTNTILPKGENPND